MTSWGSTPASTSLNCDCRKTGKAEKLLTDIYFEPGQRFAMLKNWWLFSEKNVDQLGL